MPLPRGAAPSARVRIGLVSDTHGVLRPEVLDFLAGCDQLIHAGDICERAILDALASIAPLTAVRGNNDHGLWATELSESAILRAGGIGICVIHDLSRLDAATLHESVRVVVSGHSHRPHAAERSGRLFVNPGSAGPRRFRLPIAAAELLIEGSAVTARIREFG